MAHRTFTDSAGRAWEVWTVVPSHAERRRALEEDAEWNARERREHQEQRVLLSEQWARGWLTFQTRDEKRRLASFPDNWTELTAEELEALCERATPVQPPRRLVE
jgi:hypothetical protein